MEYFGICAQPGVELSTWGNQSWPARMAIATMPYHLKINDWKLVYREDAIHDTIISNVASLSEEETTQISEIARAKAVEECSDIIELKKETARKIHYTLAYCELNGIDRMVEVEKKRQQVGDDWTDQSTKSETITEEISDMELEEEFPKPNTNLPPSRDSKRKRKESLTGLTNHLFKVSSLHKLLNVRLGIGRSLCKTIGKDHEVPAGLGVFTRVEYDKSEIICVLEGISLELKDGDGRRASNTYAEFINDPNDESLENSVVVFDHNLKKYVIRANTNIESQHELLMKHYQNLFTVDLVTGIDLMQKIQTVEDR
jgi:hypothetical protein